MKWVHGWSIWSVCRICVYLMVFACQGYIYTDRPLRIMSVPMPFHPPTAVREVIDINFNDFHLTLSGIDRAKSAVCHILLRSAMKQYGKTRPRKIKYELYRTTDASTTQRQRISKTYRPGMYRSGQGPYWGRWLLQKRLTRYEVCSLYH